MTAKRIIQGIVRSYGTKRKHVEILKEHIDKFKNGDRVYILEECLITTKIKNINKGE